MRLIDADAAADKIMRDTEAHADEIGVGGVALMIGFARALRDETDFPTIDAQPVRHSHWILSDNGEASCSECHCDGEPYMNYCPMCGKKMGG